MRMYNKSVLFIFYFYFITTILLVFVAYNTVPTINPKNPFATKTAPIVSIILSDICNKHTWKTFKNVY